MSVDEERGDIDLPSMSSIRFDIDCRTLDRTHRPVPIALLSGAPSASRTALVQVPVPSHLPVPMALNNPIGGNHTFIGLNAVVLRKAPGEAIQFRQMVPRLLCTILSADTG